MGKIAGVRASAGVDLRRSRRDVVDAVQRRLPSACTPGDLMRDGTVQDVRDETSSGNEYFDRSAVRAVKSASPFPPLPRGFQDEFLGIHFTFVQKD